MTKKKQNNDTNVKWDKRSTLAVIGLIPLFIVMFFLFTLGERGYDWKLKDLEGKTTGTIMKIESIEASHQGFDGGKIVDAAYYVTFSYSVDGNHYTNEMLLEASQKQAKEIKRIDRFRKDEIVVVRYDLNNPEESLIEFQTKPNTR